MVVISRQTANNENWIDQTLDMYIPKINMMHDRERIVAFMQRFSFATIITAHDNVPVATHLPFLVKEEGGELYLYSHFAKQNEQWKDITDQQVLVVFNEPHAYISPSHYEKEQNVPTWNYLAVHAYGKGELITEPAALKELMEATIDFYEAAFRTQFEQLSEKYVNGLIAGVVGFRITITQLLAKEKLSQNKTIKEQQHIITSLSSAPDTAAEITAEYMQQNLDKKQ